MEVERRRKSSGWNELSTEKENMILKFIGFFRGPILYVRAPMYLHTIPKTLLTPPIGHGSGSDPSSRSSGLD